MVTGEMWVVLMLVAAMALMAVFLNRSVRVFLCVVHTVTRTFAQLLTGQIIGLLHRGHFDTFKAGKSSNPFSGIGDLYHSNPPCS